MKKEIEIKNLEDVIKKIRSRFRPMVVWEWAVVAFFVGFIVILGATFLLYRYYNTADVFVVSEPENQAPVTLRQDELDEVLQMLESRIQLRPVGTDVDFVTDNIDQ
jgi:hypothetical protein